jgi:isoquinoline 1-oxidoreductase beta subunit
MSTLGTITRRGLLLGSAAVAGGVVFGYYRYQQPLPNPLSSALSEGGVGKASVAQSHALTPYLVINQEGFTIITPRTELGQGIQTTLAALVAEELDVDWTDVQVAHGPPSATYYTDLSGSAAPPYDDSLMANTMRNVMGVASRFMGLQVTGGSASARDGYIKMRLAGAAARQTLMEVAAHRWGLPVQSLSTRDGSVEHAASSRKLSYQELAGDAANREITSAPVLKPRSKWRYLGKTMPRKDMRSKCTGQAMYAIDVRLPDMLFATVVSNPHRASMLSYNASEAKTMRGVKAIVPLAQGVAVVADNTWRAFQAAQSLEFEWQDAAYPASTEAMFETMRGELATLKPDAIHRDEGDAPGFLAQTQNVLKVEYRAPHLAHAALEPICAVGHYTKGELHIWAANQIPTQAKKLAAETAGLDADNVHLHVTVVGGSFGRRTDLDYILQIAAIAKGMPERPIKLTWSREEDMRQDFYRPSALAQMQGVMGDDGRPQAIQMDIISQSTSRSWGKRVGIPTPGPDRILAEGAGDAPYSAPHHQVSAFASSLDVPSGFWRAVGASYNGFFNECFLDELAHAGQRDPMDMRLAMTEDQFPQAHAVLKKLRTTSRWDQAMSKNKARGLAMTLSFGSYVAQVVEVEQTDAGIRVSKVYCVADVGLALDPGNIEAQLQSGIIFGLTAAMMGEITFSNGRVQQSNFHDYPGLRMAQSPAIEVAILVGGGGVQGIGEPGVPPAKAALANAIFALTGKRIREYPLQKHVKFA